VVVFCASSEKKEQHHRDDIAHFARLIQHLPSSVLCETYFA
jgi:hypothetical protein